ncbi:MAG TPA: indole-3-glycerol phosphate synthase TrpC [Gemmatimonadaceae bacterium]|nr:indole-3-glycerol phosphate synthase TrpC [Gemmatimonadaceae bacterium]
MPNSKDSRTTPETQGKTLWAPPKGALGALIKAATDRAAALERRTSELEAEALAMPRAPSLFSALRASHVAVIAEIKRASPSLGGIRPGLDAEAQARAYRRGGAAAISVLTEPDRFGGSDDDIRTAARGAALPILRKDFHVSVSQLHEARCLGASAALLIARALEPALFSHFLEAARAIELEIVAEVRDIAELDRVLAAGATIIGVNNRNLESLVIEQGTAESLIPRIPHGVIAVAESGYADRASIERVAACGADAVLIGSFLSASADPRAEVERLTGVGRVNRGR